ncbi:HK97 family phage prohead protease [Winkia sp. UMB6473-AN360BR]|jgi:HK97 family phage prohead protease|nr:MULTISPECIES: HK97 family phage prohead protease [Winkia]PLB81464.1 hypothetical protein CYJ21_04690 [Actinomyces sp. UMB0138]PMC93118.1 hypothetical protein CJ188_04830 [Actinomyces sp. UMB0918]MBS5947746.1 HK97 family phage prohead protease [Winkia neuii]MDK7229705.1 HK97 family phage prohead protease [Winkia sp. UMB1185]MDK8817033.1 HK97 family phage prohead protease [Winkia sp. UMB6473-AN360BR]
MQNTSPLEGLQTRALADLTADNTGGAEGRTITALAVPYDTETTLWDGLKEKFAPGSIDDTGAILRYGHTEPIGRIIKAEDTDAGRVITAEISDTARGRDIATLITDGVLTRMSIGFDGLEHTETVQDEATLITWTAVKAREYSVVEFPAYETTQITEIRERPTMPTETQTLTRSDLTTVTDPLREQVEDLSRDLAQLREATRPDETEGIPFVFRSLGEYAHALIGKESRPGATELAKRAYEGAVIGDTVARPAWLGNLERRIELKQPVTNLFTHTTDLPAEGMTVEYAQRKGESTVKVGVQANEGDPLPLGKPAQYEVKSAPVLTYGGAGKMSFQAIDRSSVSLLDDLLYLQALEYGRQIEAKTRSVFTERVKANTALAVGSITAGTVNEWIDTILALLAAYDDTPYPLDGIAVSPAVYAALAKLEYTPKALQFTGAPDRQQGTLTVATGSATFANLSVVRVPGWAGNAAAGFAKEAIAIKEAPGAPLRLQDTNVLDLTKDFAVYGYAAHFEPAPAAIRPITFTKAE